MRPLAPLPVGEAFTRLKQEVIARTGHYYYEDKDDVLWERVRKRVTAVRATNLEQYLERLFDPGRGDAEWARLEAELTIGETYFFRYPEQFDALRQTILPELFERRREARRLRIWSAGCATGAEAYTLAILLHEMLGEDLGGWRISILGTDINEAFLAQAREALFGAWALRSLTADERQAWFLPEAGAWRVKSPYRGLVRFERGNLLDLLGPAPPLELVDFDLILCRNVMIYFHPATMARVAGALVSRLQPDGWLLVGHAEPNPQFAEFATAVTLPGTVAYQPPVAEARAPAPAPAAWTPHPLPAAELVIPPQPHPRTEAPLPPLPVTAPGVAPRQKPPLGGADLDEVRRRADLGDFRAAELACRAGLQAEPENPVLHFYAGLIEAALGRMAAAEDALRKAAYLDAGFVLAHYHLGVVRMARGRRDAGRKSIAAAAQLAGTLAANARLPEGAGLTAGDLRDLARLQLS